MLGYRSRMTAVQLATKHYKTVTVLIISGLLSGCFGASGPRDPADIRPTYQVRNAPVPVPKPQRKPKRSRVADQTKARHSASGTVTVARGDTLYAISRRYGVPVQGLVQANGLRPPYALAIGQRLSLPTTAVHTVQRGETTYGISRAYGVTLSDLITLNGIRAPYTLAVGQRLRLPVTASRTPAQTRPQQTAGASTPRVQTRIPQTTGRTVPIPAPPPRTGSGFQWPVKGQIASRFGPKEGGLHNDGINILVPRGTAVKSAEAGVVVYASNALEGYGNLLLVRHAGGWVTAYAHNERLLVQKGQKITKGQVIARAGSTGGVARSQLHFEIRKGRRALDPLRYLS